MGKGKIMPKAQEVFRKLKDVEQHLQITERKLHHLKEDRGSFTKNMLKFGFATWVLGLAVFFLAIVVLSVELFAGASPIWTYSFMGTPFLVGAPAASVTMTAAFVRKFDIEIKHLRRIRRGLGTKYQRSILQYQRALLQYVKAGR